ncbi:MAG TPA: NADP-dependent oxidoreductase [Casimicrobiaceae bacterium]|nr:NADP-dependent oxidoreductase [Casimicrobiaceae bacterium]
MLPRENRQVVLASRPVGIPQAEHFALKTSTLREARDGEFVVRNEFLSVDPAMRGWVNAAANYSDPVGLGDVMRSFAAGTVVASRHPQFAIGDRVMGMLGWQQYAITDARPIRRKVREDDLPLSLSLGVLGLNGVTAYFALTEVGEPRPGETVVVSTGAGSVGSAVGQIAKLAGCRTVGIAGGASKVRLCLDEFGYDEAVDYRSATFERDLANACPRGVDVYFDNTSGAISDAVLRHLAKRARVVICGTASVSSWDPWPQGARVERHLLNKSARMQGFLIWDYEHRYEEAVTRLAAWVRNGSLRYREDILRGLAQAPDAIAGLYRSENLGKRLIAVDHDD